MSRSLLTWRTVSSTALSISASVVKRPMPNLQKNGVSGQRGEQQAQLGCHSASWHLTAEAAIDQPYRKVHPTARPALQYMTVGSRDTCCTMHD